MAGYYDYVLGVIPAVMVLPVTTAVLFGLSIQLAVITAGTVALSVIAHAMFVRGPASEEEPVGQPEPVSSSPTSSAPAGD